MKAKSKADRLSVRLVHMEILLALALLLNSSSTVFPSFDR